MTNFKTVFTGMALLLILSLVGCFGGGSNKNADGVASDLTENDSGDILAKLLTNHGKIVRLKDVVEHNGKVYADSDISIPEWNAISDCSVFAIIGNTIVFNNIGYPLSEIGRMDLNGGNRIIFSDQDVTNACIAGEKIIYETRKIGWDFIGVFWYDMKTSKTTKLLDEKNCNEFHSVVSFDDDFLYYQTGWNSDVSRVGWDGTQAEVMKDVKMPEYLYQVKGEYYYCVESDWYYSTTEINRYLITDGKPEGKYTIPAKKIAGIVDGWAYYGNNTGVYKLNMSTGETVILANMPDFEMECSAYRLIGIFGNSIYFVLNCYDDDYCFLKMYKVSLDRGTIEYQDIEWSCGGN
jgi:hypothetical protein